MLVTSGADVALAAVILGTLSMTVITVVKLIVNRGASRHQAHLGTSSETDLRLQRLEQAVDAIAIEVERMSESQRFTAKVLADRLPPPRPPLPPPHSS